MLPKFPASVARGRQFHTLDALRGIAAIGVVVFHVPVFFAPLAVPGGYLAVDLFFMMSGVVLAHAYERRFQAGMSAAVFMGIRLIRLYPLYCLGTLAGIAVAVASLLGSNSAHWSAPRLAVSAGLEILFLPSFSASLDAELFPLNIPCWSLFLEIVVNCLFALSWTMLSTRRVLAICLCTGCGVVLAIAHFGHLDQGSIVRTLLPGLLRTCFGFAVGILIARLTGRTRRRESNLGFLTIVGVVLLAIVGAPSLEWRAVWDGACALLVFPLVVFFGTCIDPSPRLQVTATFLGVTSYAVYVLHSPFFSVCHSLLHRQLSAPGTGVEFPYLGLGLLGVFLGACWLADRYIDAPARRGLNRLFPRAAAKSLSMP